ncbi:MAG: cytochrome c1 [Gammaproteobacteria bacterium]|nr:cytochrome c1 [Gammaproteobacteria bacterium]
MNKSTGILLAVILAVLLAPAAQAAGGDSGMLLTSPNDVGNTESLQRGAKNFVNYCLGCHSAEYVRYNRVASDLDINEADLAQNLMWTAEKAHQTIEVAMPADDAARWFGRTPPDLSLIARSRGVDWLYSYLKTFYVDEDARFGSNNVMLPGLSMPNVLWQLEGDKEAIIEEQVDAEGNKHDSIVGFRQLSAGTLNAEEFDQFVVDLVNFLDYMGEPIKLKRQSLGIRVIAYLLVFFLLALALKKEFWKDVH